MADAYKLMTHPRVLECFGATNLGGMFGATDLLFPDMIKAAHWSKLWIDNGGSEDALDVTAVRPFSRTAITVTE